MTPARLAAQINELMSSLLKVGCALDVGHHVVSAGGSLGRRLAIVSWRSPTEPGDEFPRDQFGSLNEYIYFLNNRQYSSILVDGSIIQISYRLRRNNVIWHRLCYYPCPILFQVEELGQEALADFLLNLDQYSLKERLRMRTAIRFDFDPDHAGHNHPASHVTLNETCCRIPVRSRLDLKNFIKFVFMNFYPDLWGSVLALHALPTQNTASQISMAEQQHLHVHWVDHIASPPG